MDSHAGDVRGEEDAVLPEKCSDTVTYCTAELLQYRVYYSTQYSTEVQCCRAEQHCRALCNSYREQLADLARNSVSTSCLWGLLLLPESLAM